MSLKDIIDKYTYRKRKFYKYPVAVCCIIKDEHPAYIIEWIKHNRKIGISHIYIYDNGSQIPLSESLKDSITDDITLINFPGEVAQARAYTHCIEHYKNNCKWIAFIDVDEFIIPVSTKGNLPAFLTEFEEYGALAVNWMIYGSGGHKTKPEGLQVENFRYRMPKEAPINTHIKSIVQTRFVYKIRNPHSFRFKNNRKCVNENLEIIPDAFAPLNFNRIHINHYYTRSFEEFKIKINRGRADSNTKRSIDEFYYIDEASTIKDDTILEIYNLLECQAC